MNRFRHALASLAAALSAAAAAAQAPPAPAREAWEEKVICKKAAPAGTRFRTETCYTMAEWDQLSEVTRRDMGEMVLRAPKKKRTR